MVVFFSTAPWDFSLWQGQEQRMPSSRSVAVRNTRPPLEEDAGTVPAKITSGFPQTIRCLRDRIEWHRMEYQEMPES
jgi:hypothetical protein